MDYTEIKQLIDAQPAQRALLQPFYTDQSVFERELQQIFFRSWLYVGHVSQVTETGDYFLYEIAGESIIIVRSAEETISALHNVCRHRGSRVCLQPCGNERLFVCRYHGWSYELNGSLRGAAHTGPGFDKSGFGLKQIHTQVFQGLIFINMADQPVPFAPIIDDLDEPMRPYTLERAKVAYRQSYPMAANWKLAVENYCECYHCAPAHPEYSVAHGRALAEDEMNKLLMPVMENAEACGLTRHFIRNSWKASGGIGIDRGFDRYPLLRGHVTGSRDGKPVAPLLGGIKAYDGGATDIHIGPFTFMLAYCDHVVVYRFTPLAVDRADCEISWLVNADAREGSDYDLDELKWLWDVTTVADKRIIENNAAGVRSRFYEPGPYLEMEDFTQRFVAWYLEAIR